MMCAGKDNVIDYVYDGSLQSINLTDGGSGYVDPAVASRVGGYTPTSEAIFGTPVVNSSGVITSVPVTTYGVYRSGVPQDISIAITGGGGSGFVGRHEPYWTIHGAAFQRMGPPNYGAFSGLYAVSIADGGSGYSQPLSVQITGGGGSGATATAAYDVGTGQVTGITLTNKGHDYTTPPTVTIVNGRSGGVAATATAVLGNEPDLTWP
jgi:hypothetical protein